MTSPHDWLDKYIVEQAAHYGLTPNAKAALFKGAAEFDEMLTAGVVDEPTKEIKMKKYAVSASYSQSSLGIVTFPEGKTWDDVKDWYIKWDSLFVQFDEGDYEELALNSNLDADSVDWKRPANATVHPVDESDAVDYDTELAEVS